MLSFNYFLSILIFAVFTNFKKKHFKKTINLKKYFKFDEAMPFITIFNRIYLIFILFQTINLPSPMPIENKKKISDEIYIRSKFQMVINIIYNLFYVCTSNMCKQVIKSLFYVYMMYYFRYIYLHYLE